MDIHDQLSFIYSAGETRRFHTWPVLRQQNIADHSWHVAMLLHIMYGQSPPGITPTLLMAALCHDAAEWRFGDIPSPAKRGMGELMPDFREKWGQMEEAELAKVMLDWTHLLTEKEIRQLKLADAMEGALYCCRERAMGNKLVALPYNNFYIYITELNPEGVEAEVLRYIKFRWREADER